MTTHIEISEPSAASRDSASVSAAGVPSASQASPDVEDLSASEGAVSATEATSAAEAIPAASPTPFATTLVGPTMAPSNEPPTPEVEGTEPNVGAPNPEVLADQRQSQGGVPALDIEIESPAPDTLTASRSASLAADTPDDLTVCYSEEVGRALDGSTARTVAITVTDIALAMAAFALKVVRRRRLKRLASGPTSRTGPDVSSFAYRDVRNHVRRRSRRV